MGSLGEYNLLPWESRVISAQMLTTWGSGRELGECREELTWVPVPETPADREDDFEGPGPLLGLAPEGLLPLEDEFP